MPTFASMTERHAFGLEAVAEMTGKLLQATYQRASHPADPEDQDRAILLFDRLARGFRLTIALEARLERDRRRDEAAPADPPARSDSSPVAARPPRPPREEDRERDADLETDDLSDHIGGLRRTVVDNADILDPDGAHAATLDRWAGAWGDVLVAAPRPDGVDADISVPPRRGARLVTGSGLASPPPPVRAPRRASG